MKKKTIILLAVLLVVVLAIAAFMIMQRNNISAIVTSVSKTEEEIATELDAGKKQLEAELKENYNTSVVDLTAEEEKKIMKGEVSVQQAVESLTKRYEESKKKDNSSQIDQLIGDKAIELYSLKAYYLGQLGQMEATVKREYSALPKEKRNLVGIKDIVSKHIGTATALMNECDKQVADILSVLESELNRLNADTSIIKTIRDTYEKEKALKKAYYLKILEG